ncbi:hypothetical protein J6590_061613 [Homalodisca vitripennis]|nr:hypothetical protein J6590_061613 [Homalodisca vitripennis]
MNDSAVFTAANDWNTATRSTSCPRVLENGEIHERQCVLENGEIHERQCGIQRPTTGTLQHRTERSMNDSAVFTAANDWNTATRSTSCPRVLENGEIHERSAVFSGQRLGHRNTFNIVPPSARERRDP